MNFSGHSPAAGCRKIDCNKLSIGQPGTQHIHWQSATEFIAAAGDRLIAAIFQFRALGFAAKKNKSSRTPEKTANRAASGRSSRPGAALRASLAIVAFLILDTPARSATVTNLMVDIAGNPIDRLVKFYPVNTPEYINWNGANLTVMDLQKNAQSTNGAWRQQFVGGFYYADFGTVNNGVKTPQQLFLVPPLDTNTYDFNYCANLATNLGQFTWTNPIAATLRAGTGISITNNGAYIVISATSGSGGTTYTFVNTNLPAGVLVTNGPVVWVGTNVSALVSTNDPRILNLIPFRYLAANNGIQVNWLASPYGDLALVNTNTGSGFNLSSNGDIYFSGYGPSVMGFQNKLVTIVDGFGVDLGTRLYSAATKLDATNAANGQIAAQGCVTNFYYTNQLWVDLSGNDATAIVGRIDKPFASFTNAWYAATNLTGFTVINVGAGTWDCASNALPRIDNISVNGAGKYFTTFITRLGAASSTEQAFLQKGHNTVFQNFGIIQQPVVPGNNCYAILIGTPKSAGGATNTLEKNLYLYGWLDCLFDLATNNTPLMTDTIENCDVVSQYDCFNNNSSISSNSVYRFKNCNFLAADNTGLVVPSQPTCIPQSSKCTIYVESCTLTASNEPDGSQSHPVNMRNTGTIWLNNCRLVYGSTNGASGLVVPNIVSSAIQINTSASIKGNVFANNCIFDGAATGYTADILSRDNANLGYTNQIFLNNCVRADGQPLVTYTNGYNFWTNIYSTVTAGFALNGQNVSTFTNDAGYLTASTQRSQWSVANITNFPTINTNYVTRMIVTNYYQFGTNTWTITYTTNASGGIQIIGIDDDRTQVGATNGYSTNQTIVNPTISGTATVSGVVNVGTSVSINSNGVINALSFTGTLNAGSITGQLVPNQISGTLTNNTTGSAATATTATTVTGSQSNIIAAAVTNGQPSVTIGGGVVLSNNAVAAGTNQILSDSGCVINGWQFTNRIIYGPHNQSSVDFWCSPESGNRSLRLGNDGSVTAAASLAGQSLSISGNLTSDSNGNTVSSGTLRFTGLITGSNSIATFSSNRVAPSSISFPATTANWTNTFGKNIFVFIDNGTGVTVSAIKKNGTTIFTLATDVTIPLQPNEYFSETYSVGSPTATWCPY